MASSARLAAKRALSRISAWLLLSVALACGGSGPRLEVPAATLGATTEAEEIFRPLMRRWTLGTPEERQALEGRLVAFCRRFEEDDLVRLALVLRAFNALDVGELDRARELATGESRAAARSPLFGPAGTTRDLATLVAGAVERRRGEPHKALSRLRPLLHKMLDDFATNMLDEELVHAALGAHAWSDAVRFLEVWRHEAEPGSERYVEQRISELIAKVPKDELMAALRARSGSAHSEGSIAREIAQQLALVAVGSRDIALARELVETYKALLGSYGEAVARLAVDTTRGKVSGRTVGVLVSLRTGAMKRRTVDVTAGVAFGLRTRKTDARLVSRDATAEPEDVIRAMSELAGEGAAVIIAGVDPMHSETAAKYAADNALPVILLTPDPTDLGGLSSFIFFIGSEPSATTKKLADALHGDGAKVIAGYGASLSTSSESVGVGVERACDRDAKTADLEAELVDAVIAYDGSYCGQELVALAKGVRARIGIGLGVTGLYPPPASAYVLEAGVFPVTQKRTDARLDAWLADGRAAPSWWAALARDAAVLAFEAVKDLEETGAEDASGVRLRRQQAAVGLAQARAELWTTEALGFVKSQRMARAVRLVKGGNSATP